MYAYPSEAFKNALSGDHNVAIRMEIWQPGGTAPVITVSQVNDTPTTTTPLLILTDGSVTMDKKSDQRSQCSITLVSPDGTMIPNVAHGNNWLTPWGNEVRLYRGVYYPDIDEAEYVPLGIFRISSVTINESGGAPVMTVVGYDRSRNIARNVPAFYWPDMATQSLIKGRSWANWIQVCCSDRWPSVEFNASADQWAALQNDPLNGAIAQDYQTFSEGTDLWAQSRQYAAAAGCELYFDRQGICTFVRDPNFNNMSAAASPPVAEFIEGKTATFDQVTRTLDDANVYNQVVVFGEGTLLATPLFTYPPNGTPAIDDDPNSPTYIGTQSTDNEGNYVYTGGSAYGVVTHIVTNNLLNSQAMIQDYAQMQLVVDLGMHEQVAIPSMVVNPCIDIDDILNIVRLRVGIGEPEAERVEEYPERDAYHYIVSSITIPLSARGPMTMSVREQRVLGQGTTAVIAGPHVNSRQITGKASIAVHRTNLTHGKAKIV